MNIAEILANPATQTAINGIVAWGVTQGVKKFGANPRYAPYIAMTTGIVASVSQGAAGAGPDSFPVQAALGILAGLIASGGHEAVNQVLPKKP